MQKLSKLDPGPSPPHVGPLWPLTHVMIIFPFSKCMTGTNTIAIYGTLTSFSLACGEAIIMVGKAKRKFTNIPVPFSQGDKLEALSHPGGMIKLIDTLKRT